MEIRHLRAFVVLAEERHFGRAAARLHVAQPALSQQLRRLEDELGVTLLDRSTRRVDLTEAGRLLRDRALRLIADVDRTTGDLAALATGLAGTVRLGFVGTATYDVLPPVARRVRAELPDVRLELHGELLGPALLDALVAGELDLAVLRPGSSTPDGVVVRELRREPLVAVLPAHHPLADAPAVSVADLASEPLVTHPSGHRSSMQPRVLEVYRQAGLEPELVEVGETGTLVVFVAAGLGVGLVPASVRALRLDGVAYVPLAGEPELVPLALAHRSSPGVAVARVAALVAEVAGGHPAG
ncbi:LysR substrate-binding domain-containing protein [Nocardioides lianchengensis]|uniref:DNA-binding transcriptional regulator, LysR family n=1 Tax=Nocardioides lianchengensis TaxID=1045774 RepID=A0A1G6ZWR8_9ACTN|nr:LysR substrate-binding domain-containing protein [Nocardioides lianchengensis]NYG12250.1 DNA-binding transcriptional LysR family regulator [Nocardioides lianchengensis]SDE06697.1 DNA-binding transcriptional regulator, LysR family [Nocardioides lianchengensis]